MDSATYAIYNFNKFDTQDAVMIDESRVRTRIATMWQNNEMILLH